jgi:hypothetical protein
MADKTFNQKFKGYWLESGIKTTSTNSGVNRCNYNNEKYSVSLILLVCIGKADDLNSRINKHNKWKD